MIIHTLFVKNTYDWEDAEDFQVGIIQGELDTMDIKTEIQDIEGRLVLEVVGCEDQELIITVMEGDIQEIIDCLPDQFADHRVLTQELKDRSYLGMVIKPVFKVKSKSLVQAVVEISWEEV